MTKIPKLNNPDIKCIYPEEDPALIPLTKFNPNGNYYCSKAEQYLIPYGFCDATEYINYCYQDDIAVPDALRLRLLVGAYGDFPTVSIPEIKSLNWLQDIDGLKTAIDINSCLETALRTVPGLIIPETITHKTLYSAVNFLDCVRNDTIAADLYWRCISWNPLISFNNPFYYVKGFMYPWTNRNNIIRAEIIELIHSVYRLLITAYKRPCAIKRQKGYSFFLSSLTEKEFNRFSKFDYIKSEEVTQLLCSTITAANNSLNTFYNLIKQTSNETYILATPDTLINVLQKMYHNISSMMCYMASL